MGLFKLKTEKRNKLYYGKYPYRATLEIVGSAYTYYSKDYNDFCKRMEKQKFDLKNSIGYYSEERSKSWLKYLEEVSYDKIKDYFEWREVNKDFITVRVESDKVSVFSCDLNLLTTLEAINPKVTYTKALALKSDTLYFKKAPKYKFRTFFKSKRITNEFRNNVISFSEQYAKGSDIKLSKALVNFLTERNINQYTFLHGSYFIEYNAESIKSLIYMFFGDMLGKTYYLEKEP